MRSLHANQAPANKKLTFNYFLHLAQNYFKFLGILALHLHLKKGQRITLKKILEDYSWESVEWLRLKKRWKATQKAVPLKIKLIWICGLFLKA